MHRYTKILATLGPACATHKAIERLADAGVDVFRLNFSHGSHADHQQNVRWIRAVEQRSGRPIGVLADLQGPKLRLGRFAKGPVALKKNQPFRLDLIDEPGSAQRVTLPHREIFAALSPNHELLIDDGKVRLRVIACGPAHADTEVVVAGIVSDRKGVNLPNTLLPLSPLTQKDRDDLAFALALGVDWVALSFVQQARDIADLRALVRGRAGIVAKLQKPVAIDHLDAIVAEADAVMVARGDLGVEVAPEEVPSLQRRIVRACRQAGKPVVVATQMLESMIHAPVPTRAETSDVATAVYDGVDAVMLSAETAAGEYPVESVGMMARIIQHVESDAFQRETIRAVHVKTRADSTDAIGAAVRIVADIIPLSATVTYTTSGASALRVAHERPGTPIIGLTPNPATARRLTLVWGVRPVHSPDASNVEEMVRYAIRAATDCQLTHSRLPIAIVAGMPFGTPGATNLLHLVRLPSHQEETVDPMSESAGVRMRDPYFAFESYD